MTLHSKSVKLFEDNMEALYCRLRFYENNGLQKTLFDNRFPIFDGYMRRRKTVIAESTIDKKRLRNIKKGFDTMFENMERSILERQKYSALKCLASSEFYKQ